MINYNIPLAERMRAKNLDEFVGQEHIIGKNKLLTRAIATGNVGSLIFYGPPGTGKTTLANIIAKMMDANIEKLNAVSSGVADAKAVIERARSNKAMFNKDTYLLLDECHRWSKSQSDCVLQAIEEGSIYFIGSTTENPYTSMTRAIVSRCSVFEFKKVSEKDVLKVINRALTDKENGLGNYALDVKEDAIDFLAQNANGDVRTVLNALELAVLTTEMNSDGKILIDKEVIRNCIQQKKTIYDKSDDSHYDIISAFIKSMRGSDPDATLHYLARMIEGGEDPMFIARRIVIQASEDVGLANNQALVVAVSAMNAVHQIGMPEARIILAHAALVVALSRKSNSAYMGINSAIEDVKNIDIGEVPMHLKNAPIEAMQDYGYSVGYKYPHNFEGGYVEQQYMPDKLIGKKYFFPKDWEKKL